MNLESYIEYLLLFSNKWCRFWDQYWIDDDESASSIEEAEKHLNQRNKEESNEDKIFIE